ncbi:DUF305 domain-containing protein [Helicobacter sp. MIT 14-3879]|uniref:DUF305 domain-containing protein n=1 Tax=Helicobacter sp. MIT 14-3879 TaxID=2040649 RepID=UPI000E1FB43F|nr:DUF305 domain-containing protein [Helicobacter sp. MIT 14-3879]RDU64707.1 DUF305 domain-containing protein [Helicobacter sp. MIT 14-3879]
MKSLIMILSLCLAIYANPHANHDINNENITSQMVLDSMHGSMNGYSMSCNIDVDFLNDMIPHHQGAIISSGLYLQIAKNDKLKDIANNIIKTQQDEIEYFNELSDALSKNQKLDCENPKYQEFQTKNKNIMDKMMIEMSKIQSSTNVDNDFAKSMIEHHKGAIDSAKLILEYTQNQDIKNIANNIIKTQQDEIKEMGKLIK